MPPSLINARHLFLLALMIGGACLAHTLYSWESEATANYLASHPYSVSSIHHGRPLLLASLAFLPALVGLYYCFSGLLDRYLLKKFLSIFMITLFGFILIWLLLELENRPSAFKNNSFSILEISNFYLAQMPFVFALMAPFALLLSCLFVLGQLSNHREIIGMIQTGRGFFRIVAPAIIVGVATSLVISVLNFHWTTWGTNYKDGMLDAAKHDTFTRAKNVIHAHPETGRLWFVGLFPSGHFEGDPLRNVEITTLSESVALQKRLFADSASWDKDTGHWTLQQVREIQLATERIPNVSPIKEQVIIKDWIETPSELISKSLPPNSLGIAEINDWLHNHPSSPWIDRQPYLTQFHSHIAKPWTSLVAILLAAPLGIVFSRRGAFGGIITALTLCLLLFFSNEFFVVIGENGFMHPVMAAWGPNIIFTILAAFLIHRRLNGRPIYQTIKCFLTPR